MEINDGQFVKSDSIDPFSRGSGSFYNIMDSQGGKARAERLDGTREPELAGQNSGQLLENEEEICKRCGKARPENQP